MNISQLLTTLGISVAGTAATALTFGKWILEKWIDRSLVKYRSDLEQQLEEQKAELTRTTNELQERLRIEYGSLFQERLTAIKEIYTLLFQIDRYIVAFSPVPEYRLIGDMIEYRAICDHTIRIEGMIGALDKKIGLSLIYFSQTDAAMLLNLMERLNKLRRAISEWDETLEYGNDLSGAVNKCVGQLKKEQTEELIASIRQNFRQLIGVR